MRSNPNEKNAKDFCLSASHLHYHVQLSTCQSIQSGQDPPQNFTPRAPIYLAAVQMYFVHAQGGEMLPQHKSSKSLQVDAQWFCKFEYNTGVEFVFFYTTWRFFLVPPAVFSFTILAYNIYLAFLYFCCQGCFRCQLYSRVANMFSSLQSGFSIRSKGGVSCCHYSGSYTTSVILMY